MNKLTINAKTGYLESSNSFAGFDAAKKAKFIEIAAKFMHERHEMPEIAELCDAVDIARRTFERHRRDDPVFKDQWQELLLRAQDVLVGVMYSRGKTPGGYMDRITWLRRHFPEEWNPEFKVKQEISHSVTAELLDKADAYDAEVINDSRPDT